MSQGRVIEVVGMQYGSEGKGVIAELLGHISQVAIRTGGPNAGHTVDYKGKKYAMRHVPCAWTNPHCILMIGPEGLVNEHVLMDEMDMVEQALGQSLAGRFFIHENVMIITEEHERKEHEDSFGKAGSTREGVGAATADRVMRKATKITNSHIPDEYIVSKRVYMDMVHGIIDGGGTVLLEGTQGYGLSLYHGPYPYCTSRDTSAGSLAGGCGISPRQVTDVVGVLRTFPIRIAGNSGPLANEVTFESIGVKPEFTTVTKKQRRIGKFDHALFQEALKVNRPTELAVMFLDYLPKGHDEAFLDVVTKTSGVPVGYRGYGPDIFRTGRSTLFHEAVAKKGNHIPEVSNEGL